MPTAPRSLRVVQLGLLLGMLVPIWSGRYVPAFDYPNHLLEAQIVAHYTEARYSYADSYELRPDWYWETNSLTTVLLVGLGRWLPITLAGHLVLSLYVILFLTGYELLLRRSGNTWPALWLAPLLAYNFAFAAGWINFCYGIALGLFALVIYQRWRSQSGWSALAGLALVLWPIYLAHLMAWLLVVITIAAVAGTMPFQWRWRGRLLLALSSAVLPMLMTWPTLAIGAALVTPGVWGVIAVVRGLRLRSHHIVVITLSLIGLALTLIKFGQAPLTALFPDFGLDVFTKVSNLARVFTLPPQFNPPDPTLGLYNGSLLVFVPVVVGLLVWGSLQSPRPSAGYGLAALPFLAILYVVLPGQTPYLRGAEPRILWWGGIVALAGIRLPPVGSFLHRSLTVCSIGLGLLSLSGAAFYARAFEQKAVVWESQLSTLRPAQRLLVFSPERVEAGVPFVQRLLDPFYRGVNFSTTYALQHGGFVSQTFNNGPVRPRATIPTPVYYWDDAENIQFVAEQCVVLREVYQVVLVWGVPSAAFEQALQQCFGPGQALPDMTIWLMTNTPEAAP